MVGALMCGAPDNATTRAEATTPVDHS